ncbi:MAG: hypothetical protein GOV02_04360, partial [Candidatus Aenigmarchaeota archaeon]|nr:hypothetical protein [Candidatus Aenigmarchaeota archaeon]
MLASNSNRTYRKSFTVSTDVLQTDMEENLPVYAQDVADIKKLDAKEIILDYSDRDVRNVTTKYGMTVADHVITAYLMRDISDQDYAKLMTDIDILSGEHSQVFRGFKDFKHFAKVYDNKDFVIPGVVMEALESGDVAMAKEKLDKYHQLANS